MVLHLYIYVYVYEMVHEKIDGNMWGDCYKLCNIDSWFVINL